jgi:hypothetical protein
MEVSDFDISHQAAGIIQNAENIHNDFARQRNHRKLGLVALGGSHYGEASVSFVAALRDDPSDLELHYYLALALLGGMRPNRHEKRNIISVQRHLNSAGELPHARVLLILVNEDYGLFWRKYSAVSDGLRELVRKTDTEHVDEILRHVPAPEARTWKLLTSRN